MRGVLFLFSSDLSPTEISTLSLHDALPICTAGSVFPYTLAASERRTSAGRARPGMDWSRCACPGVSWIASGAASASVRTDRKSTRLNSSHQIISYAVFCLKKKNKHTRQHDG